MANEKHQPWMKWYPADWRADPPLRMCSLAARGLWIEMLGYMHEAEPYGHLLVSGLAPSIEDLASLVGTPAGITRKALAELESRNVFSRTGEGTIYSRKMVRDKARAEQDRSNGKRGGNPKIVEPDNRGVNPRDKAQIPEARDQKEEPPSGVAPPANGALNDGARGSRLSADWQPDADDCGFAAELGLEPERTAARFRDYWHAKPGKDGRKTDWSATWRNWCRRDADDAAKPPGGGQSGGDRPRPGGVMDAAARVIARRHGQAGL